MKNFATFALALALSATVSLPFTSSFTDNFGVAMADTMKGDTMGAKILGSGSLKDADAGHRGSGIAKLVQSKDGKVTLDLSNFKSTNGPDLKVYLVKTDKIMSASDVTGNVFLSLGPLQSPQGDQSYALPEGVNPAEFGSIAIFCQQYSVLFSAASLDAEM
jgi:hypothetical protein